jgi:hypothetical protein
MDFLHFGYEELLLEVEVQPDLSSSVEVLQRSKGLCLLVINLPKPQCCKLDTIFYVCATVVPSLT